MALSAYLPLEAVYKFHEVAETWKLRRYAAAVGLAAGAERVRPAFAESAIHLFRDRTAQTTRQTDGGQDAPQTCTVYTRTRLYTTEDDPLRPCDVLFDAQPQSATFGSAWQATRRGDWDEARGFAVVLTRAGKMGEAPWA